MSRSLADWLHWQESLHPRAIDLGLERPREVATRLALQPPPGHVFTIAGTNGKGTAAHYLAGLLQRAGRLTGLYTSPHLVRYNERVRIGGMAIADAELIAACEAVEAARDDVPLTYFEFGTLAALWAFSRAATNAWVLEVGLGGRLDAVNIIDPDYSLITTIAIDHVDWLGTTVEAIAGEKAGILRRGRPGFYGDRPLPAAIRGYARATGTDLRLAGEDFGWAPDGAGWRWWAGELVLSGLPLPVPGDAVQLDTISVALAAVAACDPALVARNRVLATLQDPGPAGRFQQLNRHGRSWLLDVAHNPQAARALAARLGRLPTAPDATIVVGLHANKDLENFLRPLRPFAQRWIACRAGQRAGRDPADLAARIKAITGGELAWREAPRAALQLALERTAVHGRIIVCGSFEVVGPALEWLGHVPGG